MLTRGPLGECAAMGEDRTMIELHGLRKEPATHPRVQQLYLIMDRSPWFTLCENDEGVTVGDIVNAVARECVPLFRVSRCSSSRHTLGSPCRSPHFRN